MSSIAIQGGRYYPLDNSAIIHIAARDKTYSNIFRISAQLKEYVDIHILQKALDIVTPRFPTIVAGLKAGLFNYHVVPVIEQLKIARDQNSFTSLTKEEMNKCALRVFYSDKSISVEFFHSLTDGHGGLVFFNTLLATYVRLRHGVNFDNNSLILNPFDEVNEQEVRDDYSVFANHDKSSLSHCFTYKLPGIKSKDKSVKTVTEAFDLQQLIDLSHKYNTTLTVLLTAILFKSISNLQKLYENKRVIRNPIRMMIPVDLRKHFKSKTLRNFTLYVMPKLNLEDCAMPLEELIRTVQAQFNEQNNNERYASIMGDYDAKNKSTFLSHIPLPLKCLILRCAYHIYGDRSSTITLSNLGKVELPPEIAEYVNGVSFALTPKIKSNYNCSVISFNNKLYVSFSVRYVKAELADMFFKQLADLGVAHCD